MVVTAVVWDRKGRPRPLSPLPDDTESFPQSINVHGQVAGFSRGLRGATAVVWDRKGQPRPLSPLPGDTTSLANSINDRGEVAGESSRVGSELPGESTQTAVLWDRNGGARPLPPLPGDTDAKAQRSTTAVKSRAIAQNQVGGQP